MPVMDRIPPIPDLSYCSPHFSPVWSAALTQQASRFGLLFMISIVDYGCVGPVALTPRASIASPTRQASTTTNPTCTSLQFAPPTHPPDLLPGAASQRAHLPISSRQPQRNDAAQQQPHSHWCHWRPACAAACHDGPCPPPLPLAASVRPSPLSSHRADPGRLSRGGRRGTVHQLFLSCCRSRRGLFQHHTRRPRGPRQPRAEPAETVGGGPSPCWWV